MKKLPSNAKITPMANQLKINDVEFCVGDTIVVHQKIKEAGSTEKELKSRIQQFEGIVISIKGRGDNKNFTVRKIATGNIGVERIWLANSPWLAKVKVKKKGKVRRAKLYYLRHKTGKKTTRVKTK